jgi:hypothetical protein
LPNAPVLYQLVNSLEQCIKKQFTQAAIDLCLEPSKSIKLESNAQMGYFFQATRKVSHLATCTAIYLYTSSLAWLLQDAKINQFVLLPQWSPNFASQHSVLVNMIQITPPFSVSYMLVKVLLWSTVAV